MKILITSASSPSAFMLERVIQPAVPVIFGDHAAFPLPAFPAGKFKTIPEGDHPTFIHDLLSFCLDHEIGEVYPLRRSELAPLSQATALFAEFGIEVFVPSEEILQQAIFTEGVTGLPVSIYRGGILVAGSAIPEANFPPPGNGIFALSGSQTYSVCTAD